MNTPSPQVRVTPASWNITADGKTVGVVRKDNTRYTATLANHPGGLPRSYASQDEAVRALLAEWGLDRRRQAQKLTHMRDEVAQ